MKTLNFFSLIILFSDLFIPIKAQNTGTFTDFRDGHLYKWAKIGNQFWMVENLTYLPSVSPSSEGSNSAPYYYVYGNQGTNVSVAQATSNYGTYGVLYNWTAAIQSCPSGWHLPSDAEWKELELHLGMNKSEVDSIGLRGAPVGGKLKAIGTAYWNSPNTGATNESGFTALPGGSRDSSFNYIGIRGRWWSATEFGAMKAWRRNLSYDISSVFYSNSSKEEGFSVRCIKD